MEKDRKDIDCCENSEEQNFTVKGKIFGSMLKGRMGSFFPPVIFMLIAISFFFNFVTCKCSSEKSEITQSKSNENGIVFADVSPETSAKNEEYQEVNGREAETTSETSAKNIQGEQLGKSEDFSIIRKFCGIDLGIRMSEIQDVKGKKQINLYPLALSCFLFALMGMLATCPTRGPNNKWFGLFSFGGLLIVCGVILTVYTDCTRSFDAQSSYIGCPFIDATALSNMKSSFDGHILILLFALTLGFLLGLYAQNEWKRWISIGIGIIGIILMIRLHFYIYDQIDVRLIEEGVSLEFNAGYYVALIGFVAATILSILNVIPLKQKK